MNSETRPILATLAALLLVLSATGCGYNTIQEQDEDVTAAWAEVENQYQRRQDLIPNLVNTVKGAAAFERETLEAVIQARAAATQIKLDGSALNDPAAFEKLQAVQGQLGSALSRLMVTVERYPELGATAAFRDLQTQIEGTENRIAVGRKRFIETVGAYNKTIRRFPSNLTAMVIGADTRPTFSAAPGSEKPPEVQF